MLLIFVSSSNLDAMTWKGKRITGKPALGPLHCREISPVPRRRRHAITLASTPNLLHKEVTKSVILSSKSFASEYYSPEHILSPH
jgi:hypothetical protein